MVIFRTYSYIPGQFPDIFVDIFRIFIFYRATTYVNRLANITHVITLFYELLIDILYLLLKGIGVAKETDPGHIFGLGLIVGIY